MAEGFEEIELVTIVDVMRRAELEVVTAGLSPNPVLGSRKISMIADQSFDEIDAESFDAIVLPGGLGGTLAMVENADVISAIQSMRSSGRLVAAICAAPIVLAAADVVGQAEITCHPAVTDRLPNHDLRTDTRVLHSDGLITSRGPGTAMEFALALVGELCGQEKRAALAAEMLVI